MTTQAKLFYAAKEKYVDITVQDVEAYYLTATAKETQYTYTKEKDVYIISKTVDGASETVTRIKGTDADADKQIQQLAASDELSDLLDGLLQYVYDKLKGAAEVK